MEVYHVDFAMCEFCAESFKVPDVILDLQSPVRGEGLSSGPTDPHCHLTVYESVSPKYYRGGVHYGK